MQKINQYLIKSQVNDWNLQSYIKNFSDIIRDEAIHATGIFDFPLKKIEDFIVQGGDKRNIDVSEQRFIDNEWFALKVLTANRTYQFEPDMKGRFNPEIDHIFPTHLEGRAAGHEEKVDVIWNKQPTKGDTNGYKSNVHPRDFFSDKYVRDNGEQVIGSTHIDEYDFLPIKDNNKLDLSVAIWDDPDEFIKWRREKMINHLHDKYGIDLIVSDK
jgi:hypothetical protein